MRGPDKSTTSLARQLRRNSTNAELRLWKRLRARNLGHKFVRQSPIGPYVVDFVCREKRLIIEVDGGQHADSRADRIRDNWLRGRSYRVVRIWNNEVMTNIEGVLEAILVELAATPPHPVSACGENRPLPASGER